MKEQLTLPLGGASKAQMAEIFLLNAVQFEHYWPQIEVLLGIYPELWETYHTKESIYEKIGDGEYQVWVVCDEVGGPITTVFFTEVLSHEVGRDLHLWWSHGVEALRAPECVEAAVETFARYHGCEALMITGRRGWERVLKPLGWRFEAIVLKKRIEPHERRN